MKLECVGISETAIYGLMEISQNVLTVCNDCVRNNQKDKVLQKIKGQQDESMANSFSEKVKQGLEDMEVKNDETFSSVVTVVDKIGRSYVYCIRNKEN